MGYYTVMLFLGGGAGRRRYSVGASGSVTVESHFDGIQVCRACRIMAMQWGVSLVHLGGGNFAISSVEQHRSFPDSCHDG